MVVAPEIVGALRSGRPVVALESAAITHGLPRPANRTVAAACEAAVRSAGAVPATIAVIEGQVHVGLSGVDIERLAGDERAGKCSVRDLAPAILSGASGGTTVAATAFLAHRVGIRVLATGGVGGVHRGRGTDVSSDVIALATTPIVVACSGAKSLLDLPATLQAFETYGVPVLGFGTDELPAFYARLSGLPVTGRVDMVDEVARVVRARDDLGLAQAVLVAVPVPADAAIPGERAEAAIATATRDADRDGIGGAELTPYILRRVDELTHGRALAANRALLINNAGVGAAIAVALSAKADAGEGHGEW